MAWNPIFHLFCFDSWGGMAQNQSMVAQAVLLHGPMMIATLLLWNRTWRLWSQKERFVQGAHHNLIQQSQLDESQLSLSSWKMWQECIPCSLSAMQSALGSGIHWLLHGMVTRYHALALHLHHTLGTWHSQFLCFQILWPTAVLPPVWNHTLTLFCFHQKHGILRQQVLDFKTPIRAFGLSGNNLHPSALSNYCSYREPKENEKRAPWQRWVDKSMEVILQQQVQVIHISDLNARQLQHLTSVNKQIKCRL